MKQHITVKQLKELSDFGKGKLRKWWGKGKQKKNAYWWTDKLNLPLLSIGQMIEFLDEQSGEDISSYSERAGNVHTVGKPWHHWFTIHWDKEYDELCDALWEAVKEISEK